MLDALEVEQQPIPSMKEMYEGRNGGTISTEESSEDEMVELTPNGEYELNDGKKYRLIPVDENVSPIPPPVTPNQGDPTVSALQQQVAALQQQIASISQPQRNEPPPSPLTSAVNDVVSRFRDEDGSYRDDPITVESLLTIIQGLSQELNTRFESIPGMIESGVNNGFEQLSTIQSTNQQKQAAAAEGFNDVVQYLVNTGQSGGMTAQQLRDTYKPLLDEYLSDQYNLARHESPVDVRNHAMNVIAQRYQIFNSLQGTKQGNRAPVPRQPAQRPLPQPTNRPAPPPAPREQRQQLRYPSIDEAAANFKAGLQNNQGYR